MPCYAKKLSNLHIEGPIIDVILFPPAAVINDMVAKGSPFVQKPIIALIDTGASHTCIDSKIATEMNLISRDFISVLTPSGTSNHFTYDIGLMLPPQLGRKMFFIEVTGADLGNQPYDALLGRDILQNCTLIYNGWDNGFQLHL